MITAFLPCRAGSKRVPNKNTKPFGRFAGGLLELKLQHLVDTPSIDRIFVSSNDEKVLDFSTCFAKTSDKEFEIVCRPDELSVDDCLDALIGYVGQQIQHGDVLWTHVTSPLFDANCYEEFVKSYQEAVIAEKCDSSLTVDEHQTFVYRFGKVDSHDPAVKKWPRTQDLPPYFLVNSAAFIIPADLMRSTKDRVGHKPHLYVTPQLKGYDVDIQSQFDVAETLVAAGF